MIPLKDNIPTSRFPVVTVLLIVANIAVFIWQQSFPADPALSHLGFSRVDQSELQYGAIPYRLTHPGRACAVGVPSSSGEPQVVCQGTADYRDAEGSSGLVTLKDTAWWGTIFTSMFMHGGILHIGFNMLFLFIFGSSIEDSMGRPRFLLFYLLAGVVALYAQVALSPSSTVPTIGASGAIAGVLGGYLVLLPRARVLTLIFIIFFVTLVEIPAYVLLGLWFLLQFLPALGQATTPGVPGGGVAYFAHVGGFIFGLALIRLFAKRRPAYGGGGPRYPVY